MTVPGAAAWRWLILVLLAAAAAVVGWVLLSRRLGAPTTRRQLLVRGGLPLLLLGGVDLVLADAASEGDGVTSYDRPVWQWFIDHRSGPLTAFFKTLTTVGSTVGMAVLAVIAVVILVVRRRWADGALVAAVGAGTSLIIVVVKHIVGRTRPPIDQRLVTEVNQSFPSGHALASAAVLGVVVVAFWPRLDRPWRVPAATVAALLALLIGISRLYLGVHWATDVLGGWITGSFWLLLCVTVRTLALRHFWDGHPPAGTANAGVSPAGPGPGAGT